LLAGTTSPDRVARSGRRTSNHRSSRSTSCGRRRRRRWRGKARRSEGRPAKVTRLFVRPALAGRTTSKPPESVMRWLEDGGPCAQSPLLAASGQRPGCSRRADVVDRGNLTSRLGRHASARNEPILNRRGHREKNEPQRTQRSQGDPCSSIPASSASSAVQMVLLVSFSVTSAVQSPRRLSWRYALGGLMTIVPLPPLSSTQSPE
jgi:hypothetical protein